MSDVGSLVVVLSTQDEVETAPASKAGCPTWFISREESHASHSDGWSGCIVCGNAGLKHVRVKYRKLNHKEALPAGGCRPP